MKAKIVLINIILTFFLIKLKNSDYIKNFDELFTIKLRKLFGQNNINYVCDKAGKSFNENYEGGYDAKVFAKKQPNKYQNSIINFLRDSKYKYIKKYYSRIAIFFVFLVLDLIFIFLWISYCSCCCCNCCLFKMASPVSKTCRKAWLLSSLVFNFLVIIFSFVLLLLINPFFKKSNGIACSAFTLIEHFREGVGNSYPQEPNGWMGFPKFIDILNNGNYQLKQISNFSQISQLYVNANNSYNNLEEEDTCNISYIINENDFNKDFYSAYNILNSSTSYLDINDLIMEVEDAYDVFTDSENDACQDVYDIFHDYINSHFKRTCLAIFSLTLIFGVLGFIFLSLYFILKSNIFRIIYIFIWNISMLLMIFSILLSIIFGILSYVLNDSIQVIQYILSKDNLDNEDSIFFESNSYVSNIIDICVNKEGDFLKTIIDEDTIDIIRKVAILLNENIDRFDNIIYQLKSTNCSNENEKDKQIIINFYEFIKEKIYVIVNIILSFIDTNCNFAKNDKMIVLSQIDSSSKKAKLICGLSFVVGILLGISILSGILFVHKYNYETVGTKQDLNETAMNFKV